MTFLTRNEQIQALEWLERRGFVTGNPDIPQTCVPNRRREAFIMPDGNIAMMPKRQFLARICNRSHSTVFFSRPAKNITDFLPIMSDHEVVMWGEKTSHDIDTDGLVDQVCVVTVAGPGLVWVDSEVAPYFRVALYVCAIRRATLIDRVLKSWIPSINSMCPPYVRFYCSNDWFSLRPIEL